MNQFTALALTGAGVSAAGACAAMLLRPGPVASRRVTAARWALSAPGVWAGVRWLVPALAPTANKVAALGVGWAAFTTACLALRQVQPAAGRLPPAQLAGAAAVAVAISVMWHDLVLPSAPL